ncbi:MAG: hypothetical protein ACTSU7_01890 [Candidatus Heimdallarchaeaceae archaeon]
MANELNYTQYDFNDIVTQLENRLKLSDVWHDTYKSSTGQMLIELFAYVANLTLYYIERRAEESYINTAQNRSSIINLVKLINYEPKRVVSSTGILTFYLDEANDYNVFIPKWTECQTTTGIKFLTLEATTIIKGETSLEVNAIQGELATLEVTGDGTTDQEYIISETNVEDSSNNDTLIVVVDGETWTKVSSFLYSENTSKHYRVITNLDDTVTIKFGNDVKGKAPENGSSIIITYVLSDGLDGNVYTDGSITTINNTIYNTNSETVSDINVSNDATIVDSDSTLTRSFLGGDDRESTEEIRYEAPRVFATGDRAVTKNDFIAILENMPGIANVNVWGELEEAEDAGKDADYEMLNKIKICMILQEWETANSTFEATVSEDLYDQSMIAVKYEFVDPVIIKVIVNFSSIVAASGSSLTDVQSTVESALATKFILGDTTKLGTPIRYSNLVRTVDALDDVEYHTMTLEIYKELEENYDSDYDYGETLDLTKIKTGSVKVYIGDTEVAVDDGSEGFTDESSTYTVTGSIDYDTGEIGINIVESVGSETVSVRYRQDNSATNEDNDLLTRRYEICKLYDVEVNSIAIIES